MSCFQALLPAAAPAAFPVPQRAGAASNRSCFRDSVLGTTSAVVRNRVRAKAVTQDDQPRRLADFHPDIWGDRFLAPSPNASANEMEILEHEKLKQEVRKMIIAGIEDPSKNMDLVDTIQRLGVSYHFEEEIKELLERMHRNLDAFVKDNADDLHQISLCFRLLRQQGYKVSSEMFNSFKYDEGNFKQSLTEDGKGLLSLYEATHLRIHGEDILEKAFTFSVAQLKSVALNNASMLLTRQINHALRFPIQRTIPRLVARFYISMYQEKPSHNPRVLKFSKLDFNILQKQYQKELSQISRWWKELDVKTNFPFARDRMVEVYFCMMQIYFEPQYALGRAILSKAIAMASIQDDIYDAYGTPEELEPLTEAIQRWDPDVANQLPGYIKNFYRALLGLYNEIEDEIAAEGKLYKVQYAKEEVKRVAKAYMREVKWFQQNYTPTMDEYMEVGLVTSGCTPILTVAFAGVLGEIVTKTTFEWLVNFPKIVVATSTLGRLYDDLADHVHEIEQVRGHVPSAVECYMKQYGVTEHEAVEELSKLMEGAWKDINEEYLGLSKTIPMSLLTPIINYVRLGPVLYHERDGFTNPHAVKDFVTSILVDPIPY